MPRLFTALEVPPDIAAGLATLRGGLPGARWIDPEDYHVTLRFIGDIDDATARDVALALAEIRRGPVTVTLADFAVFGGGKPRAIVMVAKPDPALVALHTDQEHLMRRIGLPPETRKYLPHITLARLRGTGPQAVAASLAAAGLVPSRSFCVDRFVLFSARESVGGGPYVAEAVYPLA